MRRAAGDVRKGALALVLAALAPACAAPLAGLEDGEPTPAAAPPAARGDILDWLEARGLDLLDLASARVAFGPGLLAHARVTRWVALGAGQLGPPPRKGSSSLTVPLYGFGWMKREGGTWNERRVELGISTFYVHDADGQALGGNRTTFGEASRDAFDVGAELHLALLGAAAELRPHEALDFLAGLIGFDPFADDPPPRAAR